MQLLFWPNFSAFAVAHPTHAVAVVCLTIIGGFGCAMTYQGRAQRDAVLRTLRYLATTTIAVVAMIGLIDVGAMVVALFKPRAPLLEPIMQVRIVELQVGVEVVGEDLVVTGDVLDDATTDAFEKALGNRLQRAVDDAVDVHGFMGQKEFNLRQHVVDRELVGVHEVDHEVDIERAAVKESGEELTGVHRGIGVRE